MTNSTQTQQNTNKGFFDSILYANQARINSIRTIKTKGKSYFALSITLMTINNNGKKSYTSLEVNARGEKVNQILNTFSDEFPNRNDQKYWIADIAIGSLKSDIYYSKKYNCYKSQLKGRLIQINSLTIEGKAIFGEPATNNHSVLVAQAYINTIDMENKKAKASILDGLISSPEYHTIKLDFNEITEFDELDKEGLCPRGFDYRDQNAKIYGIFEIENIRSYVYQYKEEALSCLKGNLTKVRYLKANDTVITSKSTLKKAANDFEQGHLSA
ncbi:DUF3577 domain-containing protein [Pasteurella atlantica]|uniref:DUF3577 domain-containing protein n=2 Tax=Pasteurellaceae TaxID=712 RepID=A0ACC6HLJ4_9PAST|nr:DUF3577 domain-containing protein [Pasteurella atlantica]MDP8051521.1 DUF3577 domain-containing protein [Pasteurella atlantica]MDP8104900.1 DUF3577 domain-containing protein [Pasteurella atlantica]MDP8148274.1 DUF3577 domain-containing protein [Pasteurella atlantica]